MDNLTPLLQHSSLFGLLLSGVLSVLILWSLWINPEMWLHDAPREVQERFGPMSAKAKRQRTWFAIPFFLVLVGIVVWSLWQLPSVNPNLSFGAIFIHLFVMLMIFNLIDLVVIDWGLVETLRPDFIFQTRLGQLMEKRYYAFHFYGFLKGTAGILVVSLLLAGAITVLI